MIDFDYLNEIVDNFVKEHQDINLYIADEFSIRSWIIRMDKGAIRVTHSLSYEEFSLSKCPEAMVTNILYSMLNEIKNLEEGIKSLPQK